MRTYLYKLSSDRGGAPCAPPARRGRAPLLTLSICKPAIRRTAHPGDRILGLTSRALQASDGYPPASVIYAATVDEVLPARDYYAPRSAFRSRPDCIYEFDHALGDLRHTGRTALHADPAHLARDLGRYPYYRNGHILLCRDFRYFGPAAIAIPNRLPHLRHTAEALGQGHRVFTAGDDAAMDRELDAIFRALRKLPTRHTPTQVHGDAYDHRSAGTCMPPAIPGNHFRGALNPGAPPRC